VQNLDGVPLLDEHLAKLESVREELNEIRLAVAGFEREQGR